MIRLIVALISLILLSSCTYYKNMVPLDDTEIAMFVGMGVVMAGDIGTTHHALGKGVIEINQLVKKFID